MSTCLAQQSIFRHKGGQLSADLNIQNRMHYFSNFYQTTLQGGTPKTVDSNRVFNEV